MCHQGRWSIKITANNSDLFVSYTSFSKCITFTLSYTLISANHDCKLPTMHLDRVLTVPEGSVLLASSDSAGQAHAAAGRRRAGTMNRLPRSGKCSFLSLTHRQLLLCSGLQLVVLRLCSAPTHSVREFVNLHTLGNFFSAQCIQ